MQLTPEQAARFASDGHLFLEGVFSAARRLRRPPLYDGGHRSADGRQQAGLLRPGC